MAHVRAGGDTSHDKDGHGRDGRGARDALGRRLGWCPVERARGVHTRRRIEGEASAQETGGPPGHPALATPAPLLASLPAVLKAGDYNTFRPWRSWMTTTITAMTSST